MLLGSGTVMLGGECSSENDFRYLAYACTRTQPVTTVDRPPCSAKGPSNDHGCTAALEHCQHQRTLSSMRCATPWSPSCSSGAAAVPSCTASSTSPLLAPKRKACMHPEGVIDSGR
jgi:hypothetical protein